MQIDFYARAAQTNIILSTLYVQRSHTAEVAEAGICVAFWSDAKIKYHNGVGWQDSGVTYNNSTWYHIRYVVHDAARTYDLYITNMGVAIASGISYRNNVSCDYISLATGTNNLGTTYIDDITIDTPLREITCTADGQSTAAADVKVARKVTCTADGQSTTSCTLEFLAIPITCTADAQSTALVAAVKVLRKISVTSDGQSTATCDLTLLIINITCTAAGQSTASAILITLYVTIPPFMEKDLIDPFASGAWLRLVEIVVPTQDAVYIARNTEDVHYDGHDFEKFNLQISEQMFSSDGSIPRVTLRTFQDISRKIENIINATEGALGGAVKLIKVNEKFLTSPVEALEADYDLLASESDSEWCTFTLGMPNLLTQRFPLRDYSSSMCPWTPPPLFKGPECQYVGEDSTCTGTYDDCYTNKDNAEHWGGELGLSPSVVKGRER